MRQNVKLGFAADHPSAAGHFPGNPIVPGALILDQVVAAITADTSAPVAAIRSAKFLLPVRPGESLTLRWSLADAGVATFRCELAGGGVAVSGVLELALSSP